MIQIFNGAQHLKIITNGIVKNVPKALISVSSQKGMFFLNEYAGIKIKTSNPAKEVTIPINVNAENLREIIESYLPNRIMDDKGELFSLAQIENKIQTSSKSYNYDITCGDIPNHTAIRKFGHNSAVGASLEEVWDGERPYVYMSAGSTLYISSSIGSDNQRYEIQGLNGNWDSQIIQITASGNNFVAIPGTWRRVFRARNLGITDNAGDIYISDSNVGAGGIPTDPDNIKAKITAGFNQTLMAIWGVPRYNTAYITSIFAGVAHTQANTYAKIGLFVREFGGVFQIKKYFPLEIGSLPLEYDFPLPILPRSDIAIRALATMSVEVSAGFELWHET